MKPTKEKLISKGLPVELLEIAEQYFKGGADFCVIENYPTDGNSKVWLWRIIHPEDSDIDIWNDPMLRMFTESKLYKITKQ